MGKIYGLFGSMTGKVADVVMSVRNGEQIVRKYQPIVSNPSTPSQVASRAKLKMMSQLSAVLGPYIAMRREGSISPRNMFVKENYPLTTFASDEASINLNSVQLTKSAVAIPTIVATRAEGAPSTLNVSLGYPAIDIDRVVYVGLIKGSDDKLRVAASKVVSSAGVGGDFADTLLMGNSREAVVLAYGVRDNSELARATFGNLTAISAEQVAKVVVSRTLTNADVTLTETRGVTVPVSA